MKAGFAGSAGPIPIAIQDEMRGRSWHDDPRCPPLAELSLLRLTHWNFSGRVQGGELVVAAELADDVIEVFARLFDARFPIERMQRIDVHGGDDDASMAANGCSAFNFRTVAGTDRLSNHALGRAIDINPVQNPWVRGDVVLPEAGRAFLDRDRDAPGMIRRPGPVTAAFDAIGWEWGGDWAPTHDYHHFHLVA